MVALLITLLLFLYFAIIGYAILQVFPSRLKPALNLLIAPTIGLCATLLPVFYLNRFGVPVKNFSIPLTLTLLALSVLVLWRNRPVIAPRRVAIVSILGLLTLLLTSWPMLLYGLDWMAVANDDMANYCLAAQRFYHEGFFDKPNIQDIINGSNYSQAYWFMHVAGGARPGSELMLAWAWGVTGIEAPRIFMPVISALHLCLAFAVSGLAAIATKRRRVWQIALLLFAINPLSSWGVHQQLIGQVGGLLLLVVSISLLFRDARQSTPGTTIKGLVVPVMTIGGLLIWYPEGLPFLGLSWIIFLIASVLFSKRSIRPIVIYTLILGALVILALPQYGISAIKFMLAQSRSVGAGVKGDPTGLLFPYYLVPTGMPAFWGLSPVHRGIPSDPVGSLGFIAALALMLLLGKLIFNGVKDKNPSACVLVVMCILALALYRNMNDFGLYKLAMYAQPFVIALLASSFHQITIRPMWVLYLLLVVVLPLQTLSQFFYTYRSTGEAPGSAVEIQHGSSKKVLSQLKTFFEQLTVESSGKNEQFVSPVDNVVLAKLMAFYSRGLQIIFTSRDFFGGIASFADTPVLYSKYSKERMRVESSLYTGRTIYLDGQEVNFFVPSGLNSRAEGFRTIVACNQGAISSPCSGALHILDPKETSPVSFIHSDIGAHYYSGNRKNASFFQAESDIYFPGVFHSFGRYALIQALGDIDNARFVFDMSGTLQKKRGASLTTVTISTEKTSVPFRFVGRGSGRIYSDPIDLKSFEYMLIDMNIVPETFPNKKTLLRFLYGGDVLIDMRRLTYFVRKFGVLANTEYQALKPPHALSNFPTDLADRGLEYSGIYEDGWVSERSFFVLTPKPDTRYLVIKGMVPQIDVPDFRNTLAVSIDGREVVKQPLGLGVFEVKAPVSANGQRHRIDLAFDRYRVLPGADGRSTSGKIQFIGFTKD